MVTKHKSMEYSAEQFFKDLKIYTDLAPDTCKYEVALDDGIENNSINFCKVLLSSGLIKDINYRIGRNYTFLHTAAEYGRLELVKILMEYSPNLECITCDGETALILAIKMRNIEIIKILLDAGANINTMDVNGKTVLMYAREAHEINIAKLLLERRVKFDLDDKNNLKTLTYASENGQTKMVALLTQLEKEKCCYGKACLNLAKGTCMLEHDKPKYTSETIKDDMFYSYDFGYDNDVTTIDSLKTPFNAQRISSLQALKVCPENVYFDVPLNEHSLSFIKNAVYVTFDISIDPTKIFYDYLITCTHYHVGFNMLNSEHVSSITLSPSIKSLMIAGYYPYKIISNTLEEVYLSCHHEQQDPTTQQLAGNIPVTVKTLGLDSYMDVQILNPIEVLLIMSVPSGTRLMRGKCPRCSNCQECDGDAKDYYPDTLKQIVIVPAMRGAKKFKCSMPYYYKEKISIHQLDEADYEITWL